MSEYNFDTEYCIDCKRPFKRPLTTCDCFECSPTICGECAYRQEAEDMREETYDTIINMML